MRFMIFNQCSRCVVSLAVCLSVWLAGCRFSYISVSLSLFLSVYGVCLSVYLPVFLLGHLTFCQHTRLVCMSESVFYISVSFHPFLSVFLSVRSLKTVSASLCLVLCISLYLTSFVCRSVSMGLSAFLALCPGQPVCLSVCLHL